MATGTIKTPRSEFTSAKNMYINNGYYAETSGTMSSLVTGWYYYNCSFTNNYPSFLPHSKVENYRGTATARYSTGHSLPCGVRISGVDDTKYSILVEYYDIAQRTFTSSLPLNIYYTIYISYND